MSKLLNQMGLATAAGLHLAGRVREKDLAQLREQFAANHILHHLNGHKQTQYSRTIREQTADVLRLTNRYGMKANARPLKST